MGEDEFQIVLEIDNEKLITKKFIKFSNSTLKKGKKPFEIIIYQK
jgi:hypothetical protein